MKRLLALTIIAASFAVAGTAAAGIYTHKTSDPAYLAADGTILADPYGVGEGAGADVSAILYRGRLHNGDTHYVVEKAGWPYARTLAVVAVAFPCILDYYCFDHDAAAQLLAKGLTWSALERLYEQR